MTETSRVAMGICQSKWVSVMISLTTQKSWFEQYFLTVIVATRLVTQSNKLIRQHWIQYYQRISRKGPIFLVTDFATVRYICKRLVSILWLKKTCTCTGVAQHTSKGNTSYNYPPILSTGAPPRATTVQSLETKPADLCAAGAASRTDKNSRISKLCTRWLQSFDTLTETKPKETKIASIKSQTEAIVATEQPVAETKDDDQPILPLSNIDTLNYCCVTWRKKGWELFSVHIGLRAKCHYIVWIFRKMKPCRHQYRYGAEAKCLVSKVYTRNCEKQYYLMSEFGIYPTNACRTRSHSYMQYLDSSELPWAQI